MAGFRVDSSLSDPYAFPMWKDKKALKKHLRRIAACSTPARAAAARANGLKGGRPRKPKKPVTA